MENKITDIAKLKRIYWVGEIRKLSGNFGEDIKRLESELESEINENGLDALINHLRLCGNIPESYGRDSSEEKLYSKYTDVLLSLTFKMFGLKSLVLTERADTADVEAYAKDYSFVADAKAFRLSRTAKNQKDFKVQAMDNWRRLNTYAMVVSPIYQLPHISSQIYQQATTRNVCLFTYSHLVLLLRYSQIESIGKTQRLLLKIFKTISALNPSKSAVDYWLAINRTILSHSIKIEPLWNLEKTVALESINFAKEEALLFLAGEREKIMKMSHQEALKELIKVNKIDNKIEMVKSINDNGLFEIK
jgi:type II restriction enzyme